VTRVPDRGVFVTVLALGGAVVAVAVLHFDREPIATEISETEELAQPPIAMTPLVSKVSERR